jgi:membrane fusion protein, multidrug efflux system
LATINPRPFELAVDLKLRRVDAATSVAKVKQDETRGLAANLETAKAAVILAQTEYDRVTTLVKDQAVSQAVLDSATDQRQKARDAVAEVEAKMRVDAAEAAVAFADVATANAELSLARYNLSRTRLVAPVQGFVTNLSLRPGDYASIGVPLVGLVDDTQWRVIANFKEYAAARLTPGKRAWVWLDSHPWRFYPARVFGVGRGVARNQDARRLLPYVAPTTDWIRLSRRLQVTLMFDPQPDVPLFMGADARVLIFF